MNQMLALATTLVVRVTKQAIAKEKAVRGVNPWVHRLTLYVSAIDAALARMGLMLALMPKRRGQPAKAIILGYLSLN